MTPPGSKTRGTGQGATGSACPPWAVLAVLWVLSFSLTAAAVHELLCDDFLFQPVINGPGSMRVFGRAVAAAGRQIGSSWEMRNAALGGFFAQRSEGRWFFFCLLLER